LVSGAILARKTLGSSALLVFAIGASSPLTVLVGALPTMYQTGVAGVPLAYLAIAVVLAALAVGYVTLAKYVVHPAPFYAQMVVGFGPVVGIATAMVALLSYNCIQMSLYALIGTTLNGLLGGVWWLWAGLAWLLVAVLGRFRGASNAKVLGGLLGIELLVIVAFDLAAFGHPASATVSLDPWAPSGLLVPGAAGVLAFAVASFTGAESPPAFGEEARSARVVRRSTLLGIGFLGAFYALAAWAFAVSTGPGPLSAGARRSPFAILTSVYGPGMDFLARMLLVTSVLAAMTAFHATVARYVFALARESVLPLSWARVSADGAPLGGSLVQSGLAVTVVGIFIAAHADPMATVFVWLSTIGAVGVLALLIMSSLAAVRFFAAGGGGHESVVVRQVTPLAATAVGVIVFTFMVSSLGSFLGTPAGSRLPWLVVAVVVTVAALGLGWGSWLRSARPDICAGLARGTPDPLTAQDQRLADLEV
jgi:amino acid transporter